MKDFLKSIKVIRDFTITLNCSKSYFLKMLNENTDPSNLELFEVFRSGKPFKGIVQGDSFRIRQRRTGVGSNRRMLTTLTGTATQHNDKTVINVEADAFHWTIWIPIIVFSMMLIGLIVLSINDAMPQMFYIPFIFQFALLAGILYFVMQRSSAHAQREIEKEFYYITRDYRD